LNRYAKYIGQTFESYRRVTHTFIDRLLCLDH